MCRNAPSVLVDEMWSRTKVRAIGLRMRGKVWPGMTEEASQHARDDMSWLRDYEKSARLTSKTESKQGD